MKAFTFFVMGICLIALGLHLGWLSYQDIAQGFSVSRDGKTVTTITNSPIEFWLVQAAHVVVFLLMLRSGWIVSSESLKKITEKITDSIP